MRRLFASVFMAAATCLAVTIPNLSAAQDKGRLSISAFPPNEPVAIFGGAWSIYLDGVIDLDAGKRLEQYITERNIPGESYVIINSPGGSLFGGMELGRVIRKFSMRTDIGKRRSGATERLSSEPGECFSACALAYVGGAFRYLSNGSRYGVHRFAFTERREREADLAQIASAGIVAYLRAMDIDTDLFTLSTAAGPDEMYEPPRLVLEKLNVVNNGFTAPKWTIESNEGMLYLKGERQTVYGVNKFMVMCTPDQQLLLYIIFDPQGRDDEIMSFQAHSLMIDGLPQRITPLRKDILNGWFNGMYKLSRNQLKAIRSAGKVGVAVQPLHGAPIFFGFDSMPFKDGRGKFDGAVDNCSNSSRG